MEANTGICDGTGLFKGTIDEVGIWDAALTSGDVTLLYSRQSAKSSGSYTSRVMDSLSAGQSWTTLSWTPTLPFMKELPDYTSAAQNENSADYSSLVGSTGETGDNDLMNGIAGLWHLNESSWADVANEVKDDSGSGLHGSAKNGATTTLMGRFANAGTFDGTNDYLDLGAAASPPVGVTKYTLSAWVKSAAGASSKGIVGWWDGTNGIFLQSQTSVMVLLS
jgi:hypothetical protein